MPGKSKKSCSASSSSAASATPPKKCSNAACQAHIPPGSQAVEDRCPACKQQQAYCSERCQASDSSHAACQLRLLQSLPRRSAARHLSTPEVLGCLLRLMRRGPSRDAPLPDVMQAVSRVLPEPPAGNGKSAPAFSRAQAQRLVDAGLLEAVVGFLGTSVLPQLSQEHMKLGGPAAWGRPGQRALLGSLIVSQLFCVPPYLSDVLQDQQVGDRLLRCRAAATITAGVDSSSTELAQMLVCSLQALHTSCFSSRASKDAMWAQVAEAIPARTFAAMLRSVQVHSHGSGLSMATLCGILSLMASPAAIAAQQERGTGAALRGSSAAAAATRCSLFTCIMLNSSNFKALLLEVLRRAALGQVHGELSDAVQMLNLAAVAAIDARTGVSSTTGLESPSAAGPAVASSASGSGSSGSSGSSSSSSSALDRALEAFLQGEVAETLLDYVCFRGLGGTDDQERRLLPAMWDMTVLITGNLLDLPCHCMWAVLLAPGRSYLPALLQRFAALAGWQQEAGPAGQPPPSLLLALQDAPESTLLRMLTRLGLCCNGHGALSDHPAEVRQQCRAAMQRIRPQLLQLLGIAVAKARLAQAAGQAAGGGAGLVVRELLPVVAVACQQQALTLAEVQQAGLQGLLGVLPLAADSGTHCTYLELLRRSLVQELCGPGAAQTAALYRQEVVSYIQGIVKAGISSRNAADVKAVMLAALALARELMDAGLMDQQQGAGDVLAFCAGLAVGVSRLQQQPAAGEPGQQLLQLVHHLLQSYEDKPLVRAALGLGPRPEVPGSTQAEAPAGPEAAAQAVAAAAAPAVASAAVGPGGDIVTGTVPGLSQEQQAASLALPQQQHQGPERRAAGHPWPRPARAVPPRYRRLPRPKTCSACGTGLSAAVPRFRVCHGCHCARYCGPQCQAAHWARHRQSCEAWGDVLRGMAGLGLGE